MIEKAQQALRHYFGYAEFRPRQEEVIEHLLNKTDAVVIMPTGGGKSMCYQLPALVQPGLGIVVSPLIALMKDQVEGLKANGIAAAYLNSTQDGLTQRQVEQQAMNGELKLLYVSPEKAVSTAFRNLLGHMQVNLFAIDEAHCISAWGHDFRPEYTQLSYFKQQFGQVPVVALTATADKLTQEDIARQLGIGHARRISTGFNRPNLSLHVRPAHKRIETIVQLIRRNPTWPGIVYCLSRKTTEMIAAKLTTEGIAAAAYHAGLSAQERNQVQEGFIADRIPVICATIAFGMGIDKSNIRWVVHYNLPKNIENYYQEIGRAGRDGLKSHTLLFYSYGDVMQLRKFVDDSGQREVMLAKLDRMMQYAQASICRRKILLNYFGQQLEKDCGNCDICLNPPETFNGITLVQKAISAAIRLKQRVGVNMLAEVLRGSARKEIIALGYHHIKTYGAGADVPYTDWLQYIHQMVMHGLFEIAYDDGNTLKVTPAGRRLLGVGTQFNLAKPQQFTRNDKAAPEKKVTVAEQYRQSLYDNLYAWRKEEAWAQNMAPHNLLSDTSLQQLAETRPLHQAGIAAISGIGTTKAKQISHKLIQRMLHFIEQQHNTGKLPKTETIPLTFAFYFDGYTPEQIAATKGSTVGTIYGHLEKLHDTGHEVDLHQLVSDQEIEQIGAAVSKIGFPDKLKPFYDYLNAQIPYHRLRLGLRLFRETSA